MTLPTSYEQLAQTQGQNLARLLLEQRLQPDSMLHCDAWISAFVMRLGFWTLFYFVQEHVAQALHTLKEQGFSVHRNTSVEVTTSMGKLTLNSPYLYRKKTREGMRPLKDIFGFYGGACTPRVQEALADFGIHDSFALARERFGRHYHQELAESAPRKATLDAADEAKQFVDDKLERFQASYALTQAQRRSSAAELLAQADGCMLRTGRVMPVQEALALARAQDLPGPELARLQQAAAQGQTHVRPQVWREVHSGLVRQKDQVQPSVLARRCGRDEFVGKLFELGCSHGLRFETQVLAIGDGGCGLKEAFEEHFAQVSYLLDWRHLEEEHLQDTAQKLGISDKKMSHRWARVRMERIAKGEAIEVLGELQSSYMERQANESEESEGTQRLGRLVKYIEKFIYCMNYDKWREEGWPIASSEVESLHKRLIQKRMKLNGACWREENLDPMLALRTVSMNPGWWDEFWQWKHLKDAHERKSRAAA